MRHAPVLLAALALAGCAAPAATPDPLAPAADAAAAAALPFHAAGAFWVEGSASDLQEVELSFPVNATGLTTTAVLTLGEHYGPLAVPRPTMYVEAELVDAAGESRAETRRQPLGEPTVRLEAHDLAVGEGKLVLRIGGGSDGSANGHKVAWTLDVQ